MTDFWVILDANFLMVPENQGVDIFAELDRLIDREYELVVPEVVIEELEAIKEKGDLSERKAARVALELASGIRRVDSEGSADKEILRLAQERQECAVGTNDKELRGLLEEKGIPVIFLRQKSHLETGTKI